MKFDYRYLMILGFALSITACEPEIDDMATPDAGEVDFSTYVALGNSLTAGYTDGALYLDAQQKSYPAILAEQFREVGGGEFRQPLVPAGNGFGGINEETGEPQGKLELSLATGSPSPVRTAGDMSVLAPVSGSFNNFGVPGAKAVHLLAPGYGSDKGNPFFARFASSSSTTIVADAVAKNPTFFTLWIGNNDILLYAASGGEGDVITDPGAFNMAIDNIIASLQASNASIKGAIANIPDIRKIPYFTTVAWNGLKLTADQAATANASYEAQIVNAPGGLGDQVKVGVVTTVVITTGVATQAVYQKVYEEAIDQGASEAVAAQEAGAFVNSAAGQTAILVLRNTLLGDEIPTELAELKGQIDALMGNPSLRPPEVTQTIEALLQAEQLPAELAVAVEEEKQNQIAQLKAVGFYPTFSEGPNAFVIVDDNEQNPLGIRQLREGELILISALGDGLLKPENAALPKPDEYILDASELAAIEEARTAYNAKLQTTAQTEGYAYVDFAGFLDEVVASPLLLDGIEYSTTFATGNVFSLDGIHLTQAGAALVANEFIQSINAKYKASIPQVANISGYKRVDLP